MRRLGLDIGEKRIGVAVSDPSGTVATPVTVVDSAAVSRDPSLLRRLVDDYEADRLVVGLPLTMAGEEGPQATAVRITAERLAKDLDLPLVFWDERLSSLAARRAMGETGVRSRERRGSVDMVAAALVLQAYLDADRASEGDDTQR